MKNVGKLGKKRTSGELFTLLAPLIYLAIALAVAYFTLVGGEYPVGSETFAHLHRGNLVYESVLSGQFWPGYDALWYNGAESLRLSSPLTAYLLAGCQAVAGGNIFHGYIVYLASVCFLGALSWLWIGTRLERPFLGGFFGAVWFFVPANLHALLQEGNLGHGLAMVLLPLLFFSVYHFLVAEKGEKRWQDLVGTAASFALLAAADWELSWMVAIATALFLLLFLLSFGRGAGIGDVVIAMLLAVGSLGIWVVPAALNHGPVDSPEGLSKYFQDFFATLDPLPRWQGEQLGFYLGLVVFVGCLLGCFFAQKPTRVGCWTALLLTLFSAQAAYPIAFAIGSSHLRLLLYLPLVVAFFLLAVLYWKQLRRPIVLLLCLLLAVDCVPGSKLITGSGASGSAQSRLATEAEIDQITLAKSMTTQRLALLDDSSLESMGSFLVTDHDGHTAGVFGGDLKSADTHPNLSQLGRALTKGGYYFLFDRCKALGSDTVLVRRGVMDQTTTVDQLTAAADASGYSFITDSYGSVVYHLENAPQNWGTVTTWPAIAIGTGAPALSLQFPCMKEGDSPSLDDYSYEELSQYELIYLDGFTYTDREEAEAKMLKLSENGVRVVFAADGIPEMKDSEGRSFLGVICDDVEFQNGYPELDTMIGYLHTALFPPEYTKWNTVFLNGLTEVWGAAVENEMKLPFVGTGKNENLVYVGLNLTLFYSLTRDPAIGALLSYTMDLEPTRLPKREIVPLTVNMDGHSITIVSPADNVGAALSYLPDSFSADRNVRVFNQLLYVDAGVTTITLQYPYFWPGVAVSAFSIVALGLFLYWARRRWRQVPAAAAPSDIEKPEAKE